MSDLVNKLSSIQEDYEKKKENITREELAELKNRLFNLYGAIKTIREYCEFCKTDMTLDGIDHHFIHGFYSGMLNGSMYVINEINYVRFVEPPLDKDCKTILSAIIDKLMLVQGLKED